MKFVNLNITSIDGQPVNGIFGINIDFLAKPISSDGSKTTICVRNPETNKIQLYESSDSLTTISTITPYLKLLDVTNKGNTTRQFLFDTRKITGILKPLVVGTEFVYHLDDKFDTYQVLESIATISAISFINLGSGWNTSLGINNTSGANNPIINSGQYLQTEQVRALNSGGVVLKTVLGTDVMVAGATGQDVMFFGGINLNALPATTILTLDGLKNVTGINVLPISQGGTGGTNVNLAINNLLPPQAGNAGNVLQTDGVNISWVSSATGTVTSFSSGNLSPLFTTSVVNPTTTPALAFNLSNANANTWFGNNTGISGAPTYNTTGILSKIDDTNVILTLGGSPLNSVLNSVSLTLGWAGQLAVNRGGTGVSTFGGTNTLLYTTTTDTLASIVTANTAVLVTNITGVPSWETGGTPNRILRTDGTSISFSQVNITTDITGILPSANGGTGVNNGIFNIILAGNLTTTGSFNTTFAQTFTGVITLPNATSTLATLDLVEAFTNKSSYNGLIITPNTGVITTGTWNATNISTTYTDAKIKGSIAATLGLIAYGNGTADTVTSNANFLFDSVNTGLVIGTTALLDSASVATFRKDQIGRTLIANINTTNSNGALASIAATNSSTLATQIALVSYPTAHSTFGMFIADAGVLFTNKPAGLISGTNIATDYSFWTNNTERGRFLSTGEFLVGVTTSTAANDVANFRKDQNARTGLFNINNTSGTAAFASIGASTSATLATAVSVAAFSAGWTTSGMLVANTGIFVSSMSGGANFGTTANAQVSWWTNNTQQVVLSSAGTLTTKNLVAATTGVPAVVNSTNSNINKIQLTDNGTSRGYLGASASYYFTVFENTGAAMRMGLDTNGNLLVGATTSAGTNVVGDFQRNVAATTQLRITNTTATNGAYTQFTVISNASVVNLGLTGSNTTTSGVYVIGEAYNMTTSPGWSFGTLHASGVIRFYSANGTLAATINASQFLGVGVTPSFRFHVSQTSSASVNETMRIALAAGGTDAETYVTSQMYNAAAGTGTNLALATSFSNPVANAGLNIFAHATTTGYNVGGYYEALGGNLNVGVIGKAMTNKSNATNIGVLGVANQTTGTPIRIGGYFALGGNNTPTFTGLSAGIVVSSGATADPVGLFLYDTSNYLQLAVSSAGVMTYTANGASARHDFANKLSSIHPTGGIGYHIGAGGTITQITSKATGVTLDKVCGAITMDAASLGSLTSVTFTLTNSAIASTDVIHVIHSSTGTNLAYRIDVSNVTNGTCDITVTNLTGGALGEAIVLTYVVIKAVTS